MRTIGMSDYTVGEDCFDELPGALAEYGAKKVAIIGGKRALAAALPGIELRWRVPTSKFSRRASTAPTVRVPISPRS